MQRENYVALEMEIIAFDAEDVITTSDVATLPFQPKEEEGGG